MPIVLRVCTFIVIPREAEQEGHSEVEKKEQPVERVPFITSFNVGLQEDSRAVVRHVRQVVEKRLGTTLYNPSSTPDKEERGPLKKRVSIFSAKEKQKSASEEHQKRSSLVKGCSPSSWSLCIKDETNVYRYCGSCSEEELQHTDKGKVEEEESFSEKKKKKRSISSPFLSKKQKTDKHAKEEEEKESPNSHKEKNTGRIKNSECIISFPFIAGACLAAYAKLSVLCAAADINDRLYDSSHTNMDSQLMVSPTTDTNSFFFSSEAGELAKFALLDAVLVPTTTLIELNKEQHSDLVLFRPVNVPPELIKSALFDLKDLDFTKNTIPEDYPNEVEKETEVMKDESSDSLFVESAVIDADASLNTNKTDAPPKQMNETQDTITFDDKNMWTLPSDVFRSSDNRSRTEEEGLLLEYTKTLLTYYKVSECAPSRDANDGEEDDEVFALMKEKLMLENEVKEQQKRIQSSQALMVNIKNVEDTLLEGKRRQEELLAMLDRL